MPEAAARSGERAGDCALTTFLFAVPPKVSIVQSAL